MENKNRERFIDDLIFPRKKTLTGLWREEFERVTDKQLYV
jgi:hypothetical protein